MDPTLSTVTATAENRDATPPLAGGIRDGGLAAGVGAIAAQAAAAACTTYGAGAFAEQCAQLGSTLATTVISSVLFVGVGGFTTVRKWWADRRMRRAAQGR